MIKSNKDNKKNKSINAQSAIEFLITYSYAILILTIVISILFVFLTLPKTLFPTECTFYGNLDCIGAMLIQQSNGIAVLSILATDALPGIINSSSFNVKLGAAQSISGSCTPTFITDGQYTYCIAEINTIVNNGIIYNGNFNITANYCTDVKQKCPSSSNYIIAGTIKIIPSTQNILSYPIIISAASGGITQPEGIQMLEQGSSITIYAIPNPSYTFNGWQCTGNGCYSGINNPISVTVNNLITETATFKST
ncbi:MAG: InlB B-repeat-containing protein [Candidatus Micrarchaeia archaeon]